MCTAITYQTKNHYFGRTLDYEKSFGEEIVITPRNYKFYFRKVSEMTHHYAMIGMAAVVNGEPLYYESTNEKGLSMAGLYFPGNADYKPAAEGKDNIAPFEFIPWILGQCETISDVRARLERINLVEMNYNEELSLSPLHWIIADREKAITVESVRDGLKIYDNLVGVLTNNPSFDKQMINLKNYKYLSNASLDDEKLTFEELKSFSQGMGAIGLPGDLSSPSRFVRAAFIKTYSVSGESELESVSQFFHILESVSQTHGCVDIGNGEYEKTIYTSCCNTDEGIYYYTTYENHQISAVHMNHENLDGESLYRYPLIQGQQIYHQNVPKDFGIDDRISRT